MAATIITTEDLIDFKMELLDDIKLLLQTNSGQSIKKWLNKKNTLFLKNTVLCYYKGCQNFLIKISKGKSFGFN